MQADGSIENEIKVGGAELYRKDQEL